MDWITPCRGCSFSAEVWQRRGLMLRADCSRKDMARQGVVLTGGNSRRRATERVKLLGGCGVPRELLQQWPMTKDSFEGLAAVTRMLSDNPVAQATVVSDALQMPRLRYIRERLKLDGRVYLRQSRLGGRVDAAHLVQVVIFWFREPLAYVFYRLRY